MDGGKIVFFLLALIPLTRCGDSHDGHGHEHGLGEDDKKYQIGINGHALMSEEWYVSEVMSDIGAPGDAVEMKHIQTLMEKLRFIQCTNTTNATGCNLCLTASDVYTWFNFNKTLTITTSTFEDVLKVLLFALVDYNKDKILCVDRIKEMLNKDPRKVFENTVYTSESTGNSLKIMLTNIKWAMGRNLTTVPCYDEFDVMIGTNSTNSTTIGVEELHWITPYMMHEVIDGRCIQLGRVRRDGPNGHGLMAGEWYVKEVMSDIGSDLSNLTTARVTKNQVNLLLQKLNFETCSADTRSTRCNLCFNGDDVLKWFNAENKDLNMQEFHDLLHGILYLIVDHNKDNVSDCNAYKNNIIKSKNSSNIYALFETGRWKAGPDALKTIKQILSDIKYSMGEKLTSKPCYDADDVLFGTYHYEGTISKSSFEWIVGFLAHEVIDGRCLLPEKQVFIEDTLSHFGNGTHLTQEQFKWLMGNISLGGEAPASTTSTHTHDNDSVHAEHKRRRRRSADGDSDEDDYLHRELHTCYSAEDILRIFGVEKGMFIDKPKLQDMESALIQQIESKSCVKPGGSTKNNGKGYDDWEPWIATMIAVFILTIGSCAGYLATPFQERKWFPYLMIFMIALAVAVLTGDGIMHLLPHALGLHSHRADRGHSHSAKETLGRNSYIWKSLLFLVGGYIFFTFEVVMRAFGGESHSHSHGIPWEKNNGYRNGTTNKAYDKSAEPGELGCVENNRGVIMMTEPIKDMAISKRAIPIREFKIVAWMILLGDALHNFMDGLAIGVAFSEDWPSGKFGGISTSIAIFCHEVPHELGDFAVLLASGLSVNQALVMNYISALTAFLGGFVGCAIGTTSNATPWIFALAGGLFVYMALTNMLPEALNSSILKKTPWLSMVILQAGIIIGYVIMFVLAAYEGEIHTSLE